MKNKFQGFTLIEILVVIALISLLAAILFPVFSQVKEKGRQASCMSNLRQIGVAISLYASDYDGLYPFGVSAYDKYHISPARDPRFDTMSLLSEITFPYTKNKEIWRCSSDTGMLKDEWVSATIPNTKGVSPSLFGVYGNSYEYNTNLALKHKLYGASLYAGKEEKGSSEIVVAYDASWRWHSGFTSLKSAFDEYGYNLFDRVFVNALFEDGHVKRQSDVANTRSLSFSFEPSP
jgi:prepilin-type N-terminal cleavage/methylation domain-containing protein